MSLDAAHYINTLESLSLTESAPKASQFAIVDLALDESFLSELYDGMTQASIDWSSLFVGTKWQPDWAHGPILLNLDTSPDFGSELIAKMETRPLGVVIRSQASNADMLQRCQNWLFNSGEKQGSLLRFYEPRMVTPLMATLNVDQRSQLIAPGESWAWHNGYEWQQYDSAIENTVSEVETPRISQEQLDSVAMYRLAVHARQFAEHYHSSLPAHSEPQAWVVGCLIQARDAGFKTAAHQERWLRLAIEHGDAFYQQDVFRTVMEQQALTPADRLTAMERNSESSDATA